MKRAFLLYIYITNVAGLGLLPIQPTTTTSFPTTTTTTWVKYRQLQGWTMRYAEDSFKIGSQKELCVFRCQSDSVCTGISRNAVSGECPYIKRRYTKIEEDGNFTTFLSEDVAGVLVARLVQQGSAVAVCEEMGARLMTLTDLSGFLTSKEGSSCQCGWLSDGTHRAVNLQERPCDPAAPYGIRECSSASLESFTWCSFQP